MHCKHPNSFYQGVGVICSNELLKDRSVWRERVGRGAKKIERWHEMVVVVGEGSQILPTVEQTWRDVT